MLFFCVNCLQQIYSLWQKACNGGRTALDSTNSNAMAKEYDRKPVIYTNYGIYNDWFKGEFDNHCIWICRYGIKPKLKNNAKYSIWQFSEHGRVNGIRGYTDLNSFSGDMSLDKLKFQ